MKFRLFLYWTIVAVPFTWGVYRTLVEVIPLFEMRSSPVAAAVTPPTAPQ